MAANRIGTVARPLGNRPRPPTTPIEAAIVVHDLLWQPRKHFIDLARSSIRIDPMARKRKIVASAINIRIIDDKRRDYRKLIRSAFELRRPIAVQRDKYMILSELDISQSRSADAIDGTI